MNTVNLLSKKQIKENYEAYHDYFIEVMHNVILILHDKVKLGAQPTYKSRVKSFNSYYKKFYD